MHIIDPKVIDGTRSVVSLGELQPKGIQVETSSPSLTAEAPTQAGASYLYLWATPAIW